MAEGEPLAVGLSVGATNFAAVTADRAVIRKSVVTLYRQRPPEIGVLSGDSESTEPGLVITNFVDRIGDPVGIVADDGSTHRSETLVADGLRALAAIATDGPTLPEVVGVAHPAHWGDAAVDALTAALSRVPAWSGDRLPLLPDSSAALAALQADSGVPSRGIIAVCDFGGSGTSLTLVDAANGYQAVAPTVRHTDLSGDLIDQAVLDQVVADLSSAGSLDTSETSAIDSLTRLRAACRRAKEELSSTTETTLTAELPSFRGDIRVTRTELDDVIREPLHGFVALVQQVLLRNRIRAADLVAVAAVGGGASIPAITTTLSEYLWVPVITTPRPYLAAAVGAALRGTHGPADNGETGLAPTAAGELGSLSDSTTMLEPPMESGPALALAWSEVDDDDSDIVPFSGEYVPFSGEYPEPGSDSEELTYGAWYRHPEVVLVGVLLVVVIILAAIMIALRHTPGGAPTTPTTTESTTPSPTTSTKHSSSTQTSTEAPDTSRAPSPPPETITQPPSPPPPPETITQPPAPPPTTQPPPEPPPTTQAPTTVQPPRYPRQPPTNPFKPRNPSEPNPFAPRNPFAP
jgi:actin-like ATPase involved in cell morphogenesis